MNRPTAVRKKTLNIIYFVDSDRTKSIQLPTATVTSLAVGLGLLVVWFFLSAWLGFVFVRDRINLLNMVRDARSTLFDYESRFEDIYTIAYPYETNRESAAAETTPLPAPPVTEVPKKPAAPVKAPEVGAAPVVPKPAAKPVAAAVVEAPAAPMAPAKEPAKAAPVESSLTGNAATSLVSVDNPIFKGSQENLELRVNINNRDSRRKAEGYVWAVATYRTEGGDEMFVGAPKGMQVNASGDTADPRNGQKYAIQFHKPKNFLFGTPPTGAGKFTQVKIVLQDYSGQRLEFKFPVTEQ